MKSVELDPRRLRPALRPRPRRPRHRRRCGRSTRTASTGAWAPTSSTRRPTSAPRSSDHVHVAVGVSQELPRLGPRRASRREDVGDDRPHPAVLGRPGARSSTTSRPTRRSRSAASRRATASPTRSSTPTRRSRRGRRRAPTSSASTCATRSTWPTARWFRSSRRSASTRRVSSTSYGTTSTDVTNDSTLLRPPRGLARAAHRARARRGRPRRGDAVSSRLHRDGSIGAPPREGDIYVFGEPPPAQVNADDWKTTIGIARAVRRGRRLALRTTACTSSPASASSRSSTRRARPSRRRGDSPHGRLRDEDPDIEPRISVRYAFTPAHRGEGGVRHLPPGAAAGGPLGRLRHADARPLDGPALPGRRHLPAHAVAVGRDHRLSLGVAGPRRPQPGREPVPRARARPDGHRPRRTGRSFSSASSRSAASSAGSATASCGASEKTRPTSTGASSTTTSRTSSPRSARTISAPGFEVGAALPLRDAATRARPSSGRIYDFRTNTYEPGLRRAELDPDPAVRRARRRASPSTSSGIRSRARCTSTCRT